jgi:hypothetical protein
MSEKKHTPEPDDLTAPLYEDGEKPKFDPSLIIVISSVVALLILGALFFIFSDKIKQWSGNHHPTIEQAAPHELNTPAPDSSLQESDTPKQLEPEQPEEPKPEKTPKQESHQETQEPVQEQTQEEHHDHSSDHE